MSDRMIHVIEDLLAGVLAVLLGIYLCACWAEAAAPEAGEERNQREQGVLSTQDPVLRQSGAAAAGSPLIRPCGATFPQGRQGNKERLQRDLKSGAAGGW